MGSTYPGRNMWVGIGIQTSASTIAQVITFLQPTEVSGFLESFNTIDSARRLGTRFSGTPYIGTKQVPFGFTVEANPGDIGRLLLASLGTEVTCFSVTSVVHNHIFTFSEDLPYVTVYGYAGGVADTTATVQSLRARGGKISKMTLKGGVDDVMTLAIEGIAFAVSACSTVTAAFTTEDPWFLNSAMAVGTLSIGSTLTAPVAFEEARDIEITVDNALKADHRIHGSNSAVAMEEGSSSLTGKFNAVFNPSTMIEVANFAAGNIRAFSLTVISAKTTYSLPTTFASLVVGIHRARYSGDTPNYDPDVITMDMPWKAEVLGTAFPSTQSTYFSLLNNKSLPYSAAV